MRHALCATAFLLVTASVLAGPITISEVLYDVPGRDDGKTFVELFGPPGGSLAGLVLEAVNGSGGEITHRVFLDAYVFPADGFLVLADESGAGGTLVAGWDVLVANLDLQNGPDSVRLMSGTNVVDALGYGAFDASHAFAGEGLPAFAALPGESLARLPSNADTDINRDDFKRMVVPTPGSGELAASVPEPAAAWLLLGGGCLMLLAISRRRERRR